MNRCEEVLKYSINKGLKIEKDELYHSDTYLGSEYDEGLKHWKYIKKYKNSRGKTVYVYGNKDTHNFISNADNKAKALRKTADDARYDLHESIHESNKILNATDRKARYDSYEINRAKKSLREAERRLKYEPRQYESFANYTMAKKSRLLEENDVKNVIKNTAKKAAKAVKEIHADAVKRGTDFIEKLLKQV